MLEKPFLERGSEFYFQKACYPEPRLQPVFINKYWDMAMPDHLRTACNCSGDTRRYFSGVIHRATNLKYLHSRPSQSMSAEWKQPVGCAVSYPVKKVAVAVPL